MKFEVKYFGLKLVSSRGEHVLAIEGAKKPETRARRIEKALEVLRGDAPGARRARGH